MKKYGNVSAVRDDADRADRVHLPFARRDPAYQNDIDLFAIQDFSLGKQVFTGLYSVMNDFDFFSGNICEFLLDGLTDSNDPVRVIEKFMHQRFVDECPVVVLPDKFPEVTYVRNPKISCGFHAGT